MNGSSWTFTCRWRPFCVFDADSVQPVESWHQGTYDVICALNLLDRCSHPLTLLRQMASALPPSGGRLLVALVWPFQPYVEMTADHRPEEPLPIVGDTFEQQVTHSFNSTHIRSHRGDLMVWSHYFPIGNRFPVWFTTFWNRCSCTWSAGREWVRPLEFFACQRPIVFVLFVQVPYLCEGDLERTFYHLSDMLVALERRQWRAVYLITRSRSWCVSGWIARLFGG